MSRVFAKAPYCLELFGCCCRRLSQHGVGEVLIPLGHCWRYAFSVFAAQFSFGLLMCCLFLGSPLRPPRLLTRKLCGSRCVLGRTTSWSPKSQCVYGPENEIAAVTFFAKNGAAYKKQYSCKCNGMAGFRRTRLLIEGL